MIKKITYIFIGLLIGTFVTIANAQVRVLTVPQGGTGAATLTGCLQGNGTSAITGTGSACGSGSGSSVGWASTTADINSIYFIGDNIGKVGIGSSSPYALLSVTNTGTNPSFVVEDSTSPDSTPFIIDASGNVGIGTTNPGKTLDVVGNIQASGSVFSDTVESKNSGNLEFGYVNPSDYQFCLTASCATTAMVIKTTSGNVGIGTTTPYAKLAITNTGTSPSFVVEDSTSPDTTPFIIDASGFVGIGTTTTSSYNFNVHGISNFVGSVYIHPSADPTNTSRGIVLTGNTFNADNTIGAYNNSGGKFIIQSYNTGIGTSTASITMDPASRFISFSTATSTATGSLGAWTNERMRLDGSGNLGLGINAPAARLDVRTNDEDDELLLSLFEDADSDPAAFHFELSDTGTTGIASKNMIIRGVSAVSDLVLAPSSDTLTALVLKDGGNIGLGTTSPGQKLSVAGDILGNNIIGSYFTSTSTSVASVFPYASTTALTATTLCLSTDCRTAWTAGGSGAGFASTTIDINSVYFTGGATGKIGIGTSTPNATLTIAAGKSFYSEQSILSTSTSMTVDFDNGQNQLIRTGVSDTTVAFSNGKVGQKVELTVCNPTTTSGAISFTGNVSYRGGISPSHTTTANECDIYVWQVNYATSTAKYFLMDMKSGFR